VQWVHKVLNKVKSDLSQKEFVEWVKRVASFSGDKNASS
jgi:hypothetical protein